MKRWLSAILVLMLLCASASVSAEEDWADDYAFEAFDDGYDGAWSRSAPWISNSACLRAGRRPLRRTASPMPP